MKVAYTTGQVAKLLGISARTTQKLIDAGKIPAWRVPGGVDRRVEREDLLRFAITNRIPVPPELRPSRVVAFGLEVAEVAAIPGAEAAADPVAFGLLLGQGPVRAAVIGDCEGLSLATCAAGAVARRHPWALVCLIVDGAAVGPTTPPGARVLHRPCHLPTLATLLAEAPCES